MTEAGKVPKIRGVLGKKNYLENRIAWAPDCVQQLAIIKSSQSPVRPEGSRIQMVLDSEISQIKKLTKQMKIDIMILRRINLHLEESS